MGFSVSTTKRGKNQGSLNARLLLLPLANLKDVSPLEAVEPLGDEVTLGRERAERACQLLCEFKFRLALPATMPKGCQDWGLDAQMWRAAGDIR